MICNSLKPFRDVTLDVPYGAQPRNIQSPKAVCKMWCVFYSEFKSFIEAGFIVKRRKYIAMQVSFQSLFKDKKIYPKTNPTQICK